MPPDYVDLNELAAMLDVSRMTASRYAKRDDFPKPETGRVAELARGRIWNRKAAERWAEKTLPLRRGPKPGKQQPTT